MDAKRSDNTLQSVSLVIGRSRKWTRGGKDYQDSACADSVELVRTIKSCIEDADSPEIIPFGALPSYVCTVQYILTLVTVPT